MPEILQVTSMPLSLPEATLQAQDTAPCARGEISEDAASSDTLLYSAHACQSQAKDFSGGCEAADGVRLPAIETHDEMKTTGNQPTADGEGYDAIQKALESSSLMLIDIMSEIRQLQLRLTALEQALSNLWYPQQNPYWEYTSGYADFSMPHFINMQGHNYYNPTWPSQSDIFFSGDAETQE